MLLAVNIPVLRRVVLRTGGKEVMPPPLIIPVRPEPSPTNLPYILPAEIVEKNPKVVDIPVALIEPVLIIIVLSDVVTISPILIYPRLPPIINELTTIDEANSCVVLSVLNVPNNPIVVLAVKVLITKLLAYPVFVENVAVEILLALSIPVLKMFVLRIGGTA